MEVAHLASARKDNEDDPGISVSLGAHPTSRAGLRSAVCRGRGSRNRETDVSLIISVLRQPQLLRRVTILEGHRHKCTAGQLCLNYQCDFHWGTRRGYAAHAFYSKAVVQRCLVWVTVLTTLLKKKTQTQNRQFLCVCPSRIDGVSGCHSPELSLRQILAEKLSFVLGCSCHPSVPEAGQPSRPLHSTTHHPQRLGLCGHLIKCSLLKLSRGLSWAASSPAAAGPRSRGSAADSAGKRCVPLQDAQDFLQWVTKTYLPIVPAPITRSPCAPPGTTLIPTLATEENN